MRSIDETHDANLKSWLASANDLKSDFGIQNLPFCRFDQGNVHEVRIGVGIGDQILDLKRTGEGGFLPEWANEAVTTGNLNALMGLGLAARTTLRRRISQLLSQPCHDLQN